MNYPRIPLAQSILQICRAKGVSRIVISPGSRNAPLTLGFANDPFFECFSVADERSAAFFALGLAQQSMAPVALLCTSGSAVLNYYPAIAEAFYSQIPLVVLSADRPESKIDIGDGQTIRQRNVFKNHALYCANLSEAASEENDLLINKAIDKAMSKKGPVHINIPFEEPLYELVEKPSVDALITNPRSALRKLSVSQIMSASNVWNAARKKLILIGTLPPGSIPGHVLEQWAQDPSVVLLTEVSSNLHHPDIISRIDTLISSFTTAQSRAFRPEVLITMGGMVVSKRIKALLRTYKPELHWHVDPLRAYDTYQALTQHFKVEPALFFQSLEPHLNKVGSTYKTQVSKWMQERTKLEAAFQERVPFSDYLVYGKIIASLPDQSLLHYSNSAAIRYAQLFPAAPGVEVWCNRGTSGIDGSTSTAIGAAVASGKQTVVVTGDIGFFYDSNALWNAAIPNDFRIILVNNGGGGIFRILPGHSENDIFNRYFETSHQLDAAHLARMFGFRYESARNPEELDRALDGFYSGTGKAILEIFTPEKENDKILKDYFKAIAG